MDWFGLPYRPFSLEFGDFLDPKYRDLILHEATIIFINNYAFQSDLETQIKRIILSELKNGTRIISTKPYVPINKTITDRQMNDISAIIDVVEMKPCPNACSWTPNYVAYYQHTVNRVKLEKYFEELKKSSERSSSNSGSRRSSTPSSKASKSNSRESSVGVKDASNGLHKNIHGEDVCYNHSSYGPTTRRKWTEYVTELEMQKRRKSEVVESEKFEMPASSVAVSLPLQQPQEQESSKLENEISQAHDFAYSSDIQSTAPIQIKVEKRKPPTKSRSRSRATTPSHSVPHQLSNNIESNSFEAAISRASSPVKKKPKRTYVRRDKQYSIRGRPRKLDGQVTADLTHSKPSRMSNDARDGMELMHQMTCAASNGNFDPIAFLSELSGKREATANSPNEGTFKNIPFPIVPNLSHSKRAAPLNKYPALEKFICDLKQLYENFFDECSNDRNINEILTPKRLIDATTEMTPKHNEQVYKLKREFSSISVDEGSTFSLNISSNGNANTNSQQAGLLERWKNTVERYKRLRAKYTELDSEWGELNTEMQNLIGEHQHKCQIESEMNQMQKQRIQAQQEHQQLLNNVIQAQQLAALTSPQNQPSSSSILQTIASQSHQLTQTGLDIIINELTQQVLNNSARLNTSPLLAQLGLLNQPQELAALQALASVSGVVPMSPALSHQHQSPIVHQAAALQNSQLSTQTQPLQTPLVQNFLSSLDLCHLSSAVAQQQNNSAALINTPTVAVNSSLSASSSLDLGVNATNIGVNNATASSSFSHPSALKNDKLAPQPHSNDLHSLASAALQTANIVHQSNVSTNLSQSPRDTSTIAAVIAEVASAGAGTTTSNSTPKKARPRNPRGSGTKKSSQAKQMEDPQKDEEIERQIKVIVAKALEVDSAAKNAEKERKARSAERRKEKNLSAQSDFGQNQQSLSSQSNVNSTDKTSTENNDSGLANFVTAMSNANNVDLFTSAARSTFQLLSLAPGNRSMNNNAEEIRQQHVPATSIHSLIQSASFSVPTPTALSNSALPTATKAVGIEASIGKTLVQNSSIRDSVPPLISLNLPPPPVGLNQPSSLVAIKVENICPPPKP